MEQAFDSGHLSHIANFCGGCTSTDRSSGPYGIFETTYLGNYKLGSLLYVSMLTYFFVKIVPLGLILSLIVAFTSDKHEPPKYKGVIILNILRIFQQYIWYGCE
jgi:hypothetical protein